MMSKNEIVQCSPLNENFKKIGKEHDYIFQALVYMGNASRVMSWANTTIEDVSEVTDDLKEEMKQINVKIHELQERLRTVKKTVNRTSFYREV